MFLSIREDKPGEQTVPADAGFSNADWNVLASFWHPVALSADVADKPAKSKLLGVNLVVYRTRAGVSVARDICPHRGAPLSLGWMDEQGDRLVCPMHGHHFDGEGVCTRVPSMADGQRIPERMRLQNFVATERYGFVWACLKPPAIRPLPSWELLENLGAGWTRIEIPRERWKASAARQCENFNDIGHLSWVHMKTFGNRNRPQIENYDVEKTEYGLRAEMGYVEIERGFNSDELGERAVHYEYQLTYPFSTQLRVDYNTKETSYFFDIASPVTARETDVYQLTLTNIPGADNSYATYSAVTNQEDLPLVEGQTPWELPLHAGYEVSVPSDRLSMQYRRDMVGLFGLGKPDPSA